LVEYYIDFKTGVVFDVLAARHQKPSIIRQRGFGAQGDKSGPRNPL